MTKILILANSSAGLYDFRNELIIELLKNYEVAASLPDEVMVKELTDEGVRVIHTDINRRGVNPKEDMGLLRSYMRLLKKERPDLILTYTIKPNIYGGYCASRLKIPYISTITGLGSTFQKEGLLKKLIVFMYKVSLKNSECVFFQNKENIRIFDECGIKGRSGRLVMGSGVNLSRHVFEEYPADDEIKLLYIGRTMKEKGTDELLEAAEYFAKQGKDSGVRPVFGLLGYMDGDYTQKLTEYEEKGYIRQLGFDTDVHKYIKASHAVLLPTYHEGMSNVLQEAAATGRPVIASNIAGCREIFDDNVTGIAIEPKSTESLIAGINRFLSLSAGERAEMGRKARQKVESEFDRKKVVAAYIEEAEKALLP